MSKPFSPVAHSPPRTRSKNEHVGKSELVYGKSEPSISKNETITISHLHTLLLKIDEKVSSMNRDIRNLAQAQESLKSEVAGVILSQQRLSDDYDDFKQRLVSFEKLSKNLSDDVEEEKKTIHELSGRLAKLEQYSRRCHLELHGVQELPNENVEEILIKTSTLLGVTIDSGSIEACHRLPGKEGKTRPIIAELISRKLRNSIIEKRNEKVIRNNNILNGTLVNAEKIYINESLSPFYKHLFWETKNICKQLNYKFCWFKSDKILAKKCEKSPIIRINNIADLLKLKNVSLKV